VILTSITIISTPLLEPTIYISITNTAVNPVSGARSEYRQLIQYDTTSNNLRRADANELGVGKLIE
jgi:hypothetical protein